MRRFRGIEMADLSVTAANVQPTSSTVYGATRPAAVAVAAGEGLYLDADNKYRLATADVALNNIACVCVGLAMNSAAAGQPVTPGTGEITVAASGLTAGAGYRLSANAGKITTDATTTGDNVVEIGVAKSATVIDVQPKNWGVLQG